LSLFENENLILLKRYLDVASLRQRIIAHNIANINTPGFKRYGVRFEDMLQNALNPKKVLLAAPLKQHLTNQPDMSHIIPIIENYYTTTMRADDNNVDLEQEMTTLAANTISYGLAAQRLSGKLEQLSYVITSREG